ncbi:MAG: agmatinase family protein [Rikenellaceae bacterium]
MYNQQNRELIDNFPVDGAGVANGNFLGLPFDVDTSRLVLMMVPWDVTVSYGAGTHLGPSAILEASLQGEVYDEHFTDMWKEGFVVLPQLEYALEHNECTRELACRVIDHEESGRTLLSSEEAEALTHSVNRVCEGLNKAVYDQAVQMIERGKIVGLVGGEHSVPLGLIRALADRGDHFGILHIDAHADLREAYEGFDNSHASIMRNVMRDQRIGSLTQVAIRDYCYSEVDFAQSDPRISQFTSSGLRDSLYDGATWGDICREIIDTLPQRVYISFDIDGLTPDYCPSTGTPVPGGLTFEEAIYLIRGVVDSGRQIIGFDLCEVSPSDRQGDQWDANVGARVLYKLCGATLASSMKSL